MAFKVELYNFTKRPNSTLTPDNTVPYLELDCTMKQTSSIITPVLTLNLGQNETNYNYAYIPSFGRYYFIDDIVYSGGIFGWDIYMHVDVLGTYKWNVRNSTQYVARAAYRSLANTGVIDTFYPVRARNSTGTRWTYKTETYASDKVTAEIVGDSASSESVTYYEVAFQSGYFVVGVTGNNNSGVTYYRMSYSRFKTFVNNAFSYDPTDMTDVDDGIANAIWSPIDYITYCRWFPNVKAPSSAATTSSIYVGRYPINTGGSVQILNQQNVVEYSISLDIPEHPDADDIGDYFNLSPYREIGLYMLPFGFIPIDTAKVFEMDELEIKWYTDYVSGEAVLKIVGETTAADDTIIYTCNASYGVPVALSALQYGIGDAAVAGITTLLAKAIDTGSSVDYSAMMKGKGALAEAYGSYADWFYSQTDRIFKRNGNTNLLGTVASAVAASLGQLKTNGSAGSFMSYNMSRPALHVWCQYTVDQDKARFGVPVYQDVDLSDMQITGYVICLNASLTNWTQGKPTAPEYEALIGYMNSGFFLE